MIVQLISKLPFHRQVEIKDFAEFLLSRETGAVNLAAVSLAEHGIDQVEAANLQARLQTISDDWEQPEMEVYDAL